MGPTEGLKKHNDRTRFKSVKNSSRFKQAPVLTADENKMQPKQRPKGYEKTCTDRTHTHTVPL